MLTKSFLVYYIRHIRIFPPFVIYWLFLTPAETQNQHLSFYTKSIVYIIFLSESFSQGNPWEELKRLWLLSSCWATTFFISNLACFLTTWTSSSSLASAFWSSFNALFAYTVKATVVTTAMIKEITLYTISTVVNRWCPYCTSANVLINRPLHMIFFWALRVRFSILLCFFFFFFF